MQAYRNGNSTSKPRDGIDSSCYTPKSGKRILFIWGDSHAQQLNFGLSRVLQDGEWQILQVASSGCPPFLPSGQPRVEEFCKRSNEFALESIEKVRPEAVVIAQHDGVSVNTAKDIAEKLTNYGVNNILFMGPAPRWTTELPKVIARKLWVSTPERSFVGLDIETYNRSSALKVIYNMSGLNYFDLIDIFCEKDLGCLTRIGPDKTAGLVSHDAGHLLPVASEYLAKNGLAKAVTSQQN